jgi:hypothetical protein
VTLDELIEALARVRAERGNGSVEVEVAAMVCLDGPDRPATPHIGPVSGVETESRSVRVVVDDLESEEFD